MRETKQCEKCGGSRWAAAGYCRACEYEVAKCTQESHAALQESLEAFKSATINHKRWVDKEFEINMLQGDCPHCKSSICFNLDKPKFKPNSTAHLESMTHEELRCIAATKVLKVGIRRQARRMIWAIEDGFHPMPKAGYCHFCEDGVERRNHHCETPAITSTQALVFAVTR